MSGSLALILVFLGGGPGAFVRGYVLESGSDLPVHGAVVHLASNSLSRLAFTDSAGAYAFDDVPPGRYRLDVSHPGFDPAAVELVVGVGVGLELEIPVTLRPVQSPPISVVARRGARTSPDTDEDGRASTVEPPSVTSRWLAPGPQSASALSEMAAARAAARPPDRQGRQGAHVLYIWGSSGEQGRVLLDGAALNSPLHLGGMLPPIDPEMVEVAEARSGGASPRFDGGTTQVMEFETRAASGDRFRAWLELDPLAGRAGVETPAAGRGAILAGARRVNTGLIERVTGRSLGYGYADALVRADLPVASASHASTTVFATEESVTIPRDFGDDRATWTNLAASFHWRGGTVDDESGITLTWGRAGARLPLLSAPDAHGSASLKRISVDAVRTWRRPRWHSSVGFQAERLGFERREIVGINNWACATLGACYDESIGVLSPWAEVDAEPAPRFRAGGGVRLAWNARVGHVDALPRASVTALVGNTVALSASAGRYSRATLLVPGTGPLLPDSVPVRPGRLRAAVAHATQLELSIAYRENRVSAGATAFLRRHGALSDTPAHTTPGIDVWWSRDGGASATSVGYSFARIATRVAGSARDRHVVAASWSRASGPLVLHLSSAWAHGLPYVSFVLDDRQIPASGIFDPLSAGSPPTGGEPSRDYIRIDASVAGRWTLNLPGGRPTTITPYFKVLNALARRDALFWFQDAGASARPIASLPLVPAIGIRWTLP